MGNSYARLVFHLVFSTKDRRPWLDFDWESRLHAYIGGIVRDYGGVLIKAGGMPDHMHLVFSLKPAVPLADVIRDIKAGSSRWIHDNVEDAKAFAWQSGYGVFSVGVADIERVCAYVEKQKAHHSKTTFEEEFRDILERAGIAYDPKYLFD